MGLKFFLRKNWFSLLIFVLSITAYLLTAFFLKELIPEPYLFFLFTGILLILLFPFKNYLISHQFLGLNWEYLADSEFHHFEFLAKHFTLKDLIEIITPELMLWLKISEARLFLLNPDRLTFTMYFYAREKIESKQLISKKRIGHILKIIKKYNIIFYSDPDLPEEEKKIMKTFKVFIVVPFYHLKRLMGFIVFHDDTSNRYAGRALELYATKAAYLIHYEIIKKRMQNIKEYEEEIKSAEKIRRSLQSFSPPLIPNFIFHYNQIAPTSLIEFFNVRNVFYIVIISTAKIDGISTMILFGKLGALFAFYRLNREKFNPKNILQFLYQKDTFTQDNYPLEILVLQLNPPRNAIQLYYNENKNYFLKKGKTKFLRLVNESVIAIDENEIYEIYFRENYLFSISYRRGEI